jgi:RNase adapter protein RapZ
MTAAILERRSSMEGIVASTTPTETTPDPRASSDGDPVSLRSDAELDHLLVISGLSGAGKSQAGKVFEDLGYAVVDNLPAALLEDFLALRREDRERYRRSALVLDIRAGDPAPAIERAAAALDGDRPVFEVIFLEASDETLVNRFSETRHRHPLEARSGVEASIAEERRRLARTRELADHVVDTSGLSIGQLKDRLWSLVPHSATRNELGVDIVTFGYKYGLPLEADLVFDVRFLTNPYWDPELKPLSGKETKVRDFVLQQPTAKRFLELVTELLTLTAPAYRAEGKDQLRIALGCTGGFHRSIALAEELARRLGQLPDVSVTVFHRELER